MKAIGVTILFSFILTSVLLGQSGTLRGKVLDDAAQEELIGANIIFYQDGVYRSGVSTDINGFFQINLDPGNYTVEISFIGYRSKIVDLLVEDNKIKTVEFTLGIGAELPRLPIALWCPDYVIPLIDMDDPGPTPISSMYIRAQAHKEVADILVNFPGVTIGN